MGSLGRRAGTLLVGLGAVSLLVASIAALLSDPINLAVPLLQFGGTSLALRVDPLAGWFLMVLALAAIPVTLYTPAYMRHVGEEVDTRPFGAALPLFLLSMAIVVPAANAVTFLVAWEVMSLSSFVLVATDHNEPGTRRAALIYLGATRVGTAFLFGAFLWIHALTGSWTFADWHLKGAAALGPGLLLIVGLGVKAGMWPFHSWLPIAHPEAPAPVSAFMSGVMVKIPIYMLVRLLVLSPALAHPAFGRTIVALGAISAFWGVLFALLQHDMKRLLAYHTVENVGLILMGVGGALVAQELGLPMVARVALAAGLFHVLNHAMFKSLLFLSAGAVDYGAGTRDLERLGGLGHRMPTTFACFLLGSAAICALPPLNGFASEWLLYQGMVGIAGSAEAPVARFLALLLVGWLALIGALALACFVKASGVAFLGRPRSRAADQAHEAAPGMRAGQVILAACCVVLGLAAPSVLRLLHPIVAPLDPSGAALASAWSLPYGALLATLVVTGAVVVLWIKSAERKDPTRTFITWECGFGPLGPRMQVTATSFAQPIAWMFGVLFNYAIRLKIDGANRRLFPEEILVEPTTEAMLESRVYSPLVNWVNRLSGWVVRLQAGSVHLYLLTMFIVLLVLLAVGGYR